MNTLLNRNLILLLILVGWVTAPIWDITCCAFTNSISRYSEDDDDKVDSQKQSLHSWIRQSPGKIPPRKRFFERPKDYSSPALPQFVAFPSSLLRRSIGAPIPLRC
ncbi:hypothetical protein KIH39_16490 [Telmatocola sphagniphila]|uniref:Uncharacterized protein n=1 Tax=Telmatocola sphagniphila TaxID=1123043 RepID=A0A8E6B260_9BACT|nr:hypothetical protein [Telmatocola sphagniphila]QVL30447.1 hypothetical protein KIH39_16490 [Telmatocola sphagniphila]